VLARDWPLTQPELRALTLADSLASMLYCCHEVALGNRTTILVYDKYATKVAALEEATGLELQLIHAVQCIWEESNGESGPRFDVFSK
jgi:hypothetical protein